MLNDHEAKITLQLFKVGIDIGGTFTDFVVFEPDSGILTTFKLPSTPDEPAKAVIQGLESIWCSLSRDHAIQMDIIHGSTVATNALLENKGAKTAFVATKGFRDILQIGRQNRPHLYDLFAQSPPDLVPAELRIEVNERIDHNGRILYPLDPDSLDEQVVYLQAKGVEAISICLLFSFLNPHHEQIIAERFRKAGFFVSLSSEVLPEFREFERASTTTVNAYVSPVLDRYLTELEDELTQSPVSAHLRVMQSNGGNLSPAQARQRGVDCILSGPAGGVVGASFVAQLAELQIDDKRDDRETGKAGRIITFDMGGTSTDVSLIAGDPQLTREAVVGGFPIRIPILDIHTIGAGGGSIARIDAGGALRVGPESAGAQPGPACYGVSNLPTVTDANLILGRLVGEYFLDGRMPLDSARSSDAMARLGHAIGMDTRQAALGVITIVNAHMERALRLISVERGYDPRQFRLLSFGGAGGLHAADLARRLAIPYVIVPPLASTLSAFGMLAADIVNDTIQTVMLSGHAAKHQLDKLYQPMLKKAIRELSEAQGSSQRLEPDKIIIERSVDMRYVGQSYELVVPYSDQMIERFHEIHRQSYGYARKGAEVEVVNLRLRAIVKVQAPVLRAMELGEADPRQAWLENRLITLQGGELKDVPFYRGESLTPGNRMNGPSVIIRGDTTILLGGGDLGQIDRYGNLWIKVKVDKHA